MNLEAIKTWFLSLGAEYGVDPVIFGSIYVGAIPFFTLSVAWLVRNRRVGRSVVLPVLSAGFFFISAYLYLVIVGRNIPVWVYAFIVALVGYGAWASIRKVKTRIKAEIDGEGR